MPTYRIVSETESTGEHRASRGHYPCQEFRRTTTTITAGSLLEAVAQMYAAGRNEANRVVAVEELRPGLQWSDEQIVRELGLTRVVRTGDRGDPTPLIALDDAPHNDEVPDARDLVKLVVDGLRTAGLVPRLSCLMREGSNLVMVEVHDEARGCSVSRTATLGELCDSEARGFQAVLHTARKLIELSGGLP